MPCPQTPKFSAAPLTPPAIHVWWASLAISPEEARRLQGLLSPDERARAARCASPRAQQRFTVARGMLRSILADYTYQRPEQLRFTYGPHGKPALIQPPDAVPLHFNLSHDGDLVLCACAWGRALGVDLAHVDPTVAVLDLAARFFAPHEYASLCALPPDERTAAFFRGWTRKEAYLKACGVGLTRPLNRFTVTLDADAPAQLLGTPDEAADSPRWSFHTLHIHPEYHATLVVEGADGQPDLRPWPISP